jgi:hypothetical protein
VRSGGLIRAIRGNVNEQAWKKPSWSLAAALLGKRRVSACQGWAGEKSGLFEHPATRSPVVLDVRIITFLPCHNSFPTDSEGEWLGGVA